MKQGIFILWYGLLQVRQPVRRKETLDITDVTGVAMLSVTKQEITLLIMSSYPNLITMYQMASCIPMKHITGISAYGAVLKLTGMSMAGVNGSLQFMQQSIQRVQGIMTV